MLRAFLGILVCLVFIWGLASCGANATRSDGDADTDADGDHDESGPADGDGDPDADGDADLGSDADPPRDADVPRDADPPRDADVPRDADPDVTRDCPPETVPIPGAEVCIDRYEASRSDGDRPRSVSGVMPWVEISWEEANLACSNAGKRLCTAEEWIAACQGPEGYVFPYGNIFDPDRCAYFSAPYTQETGSHPDCEGGVAGLYDMSGNVAEWVATPVEIGEEDAMSAFYHPHGGAWNWDTEELECRPPGSSGYSPHHRDRVIGFRCCLDR